VFLAGAGALLPFLRALPGLRRVSEPRARNVVLVWLSGGPSHLETFDPKPGTRYAGPFEALESAVSGIRMCEHAPRVAARARDFALLRSLTSREADHVRATGFLHSGQLPQGTVRRAGFLSVAGRERADPEGEMPVFVSLNGRYQDEGSLGPAHAPLVLAELSDPAAPFRAAEELGSERAARREALLAQCERDFDARHGAAAGPWPVLQARARRWLGGRACAAFDLAQESEATRTRYGETAVGRGCLLARRLLEHGTRFVEVGHENWDHHSDLLNGHRQALGELDPALASLLEDLAASGLLGETLVLCLGEFGRTPEINALGGRDHHAAVFSALVAGAGVRGAQVVGASDEGGREVRDRPITVPDLLATVLHLVGIDPGKTEWTAEGRPFRLIEGGQVVSELL
jgi:uncharacterized protein (DUF1501 family)